VVTVLSRREFVTLTCSAILSFSLPAWMVQKVLASFRESSENPKWGIVVDVSKFGRLSYEEMVRVVEVCRREHNIPVIEGKDRIHWIWLSKLSEIFPKNLSEKSRLGDVLVPVFCNHCENPPCVKVCPTGATFKRYDGVVEQDYHRCIGCRYCMAACPYGARSFNWRDPRPYIELVNPEFPVRTAGVVEKCNMCSERIDRGMMPACVEASKGAMLFGDINKLESEIAEILNSDVFLRRKEYLGTEPKVYYLL
jgi:molybdopterin-containing oxidoreductase family iron-sulfur binding subunit